MFKIQILNTENLLNQYVCYDNERGLYIGGSASAKLFNKEHLINDEKLKLFLKDKEYQLIHYKGNNSFRVYRGDIKN